MSSTKQKRNAAPTLFAVVCRWKDLQNDRVVAEGHEALVLEAADANDALAQASAARPDLWEKGSGLNRETSVHPATELNGASK